MDFRPLISVVLPNYNGARFLRQTVQSVLAQTYPHWELLIVDDASTDASSEIMEAFARQDSRIRCLRMERNSGVSAARNRGIREAAGDYVALLDNDDLWEPEKLARQVKLAESGADLLYCSYDLCDADGKPVGRPFIVPETTDFQKMLARSVISCSTCMAKTELLQAHPFRPDFYHEDYLLWMELLRLPIRAAGDPEILMHYRQVQGSRSGRKAKAARERWRIYREALHMGFIPSSAAFLKYAVKGIRKYRRMA